MYVVYHGRTISWNAVYNEQRTKKDKQAGIKKPEGDILIRRFSFGAKNSLGRRAQVSPERE